MSNRTVPGNFTFVDLKGLRYSKDREPNQCPLCHHAVKPEEVSWSLTGSPRQSLPWLEIVYRCPHDDCGHLFIARYQPREVPGYGTTGRQGEFVLKGVTPRRPETPDVPQEVSTISPSFGRIYAQAAAAEAFELQEIAGGGYRKALEFLIKDFCIARAPEKEADIKASRLGKTIDTYVDDQNVQSCAKRAAWLGNDEIHYLRKWEEKDIGDLKTLIRLTVNWIHNRLLTDQYLKEMKGD